jgi:uncharacterized damage-inducible protein DinB
MLDPLCAAILAKIQEQIERTDHLIGMVPAEGRDWRPPIADAWSIAEVIGHLASCLSGFCAVLAAAEPERLAHFKQIREFPSAELAVYRALIDQGFALLKDEDLARRLPTVFVPEGETVLTLLLGNLEHLINHKHQLFTYLKLMGTGVSSRDLYCFRGRS